MARKKKAQTPEVVVKRNPGVFTETEQAVYRKSLVEELTWRAKGTVPHPELEQLADSVIGKDEETTLWLRQKGVLFASEVLLAKHQLKQEEVA